MTEDETRATPETPKILSLDPRKPRAPVPADDPRQTKVGDESPARPDQATDRATDAPTEGRHILPIRGLRLLELAGAAEVGACAGCGGRLRRHLGVSADPRAWAVTRGGQARRRDSEAFNDIWSQMRSGGQVLADIRVVPSHCPPT